MTEGSEDQLAPPELLEGVPLPTVSEVLSHADRSALLAALRQNEGSLRLDDAATEIARRTNAEVDGPVTPDRIERKALVLHHLHVPMLTDGDIVDRDDTTNTIRLTETGEKIAAVRAEFTE